MPSRLRHAPSYLLERYQRAILTYRHRISPLQSKKAGFRSLKVCNGRAGYRRWYCRTHKRCFTIELSPLSSPPLLSSKHHTIPHHTTNPIQSPQFPLLPHFSPTRKYPSPHASSTHLPTYPPNEAIGRRSAKKTTTHPPEPHKLVKNHTKPFHPTHPSHCSQGLRTRPASDIQQNATKVSSRNRKRRSG